MKISIPENIQDVVVEALINELSRVGQEYVGSYSQDEKITGLKAACGLFGMEPVIKVTNSGFTVS